MPNPVAEPGQHTQPAPRIRVALLFGGRSSEHSISCATAGSVLRHLDRERFEPIVVGITREGAWTLWDGDPAELTLEAMPTVVDNGTRVRLPQTAGEGVLRVDRVDGTGLAATEELPVDVVFPILHGPFGEDGTIQGALELAGLPYVGNGVLASAVGMDKHFTKTVLEHAGIRVAPWMTVSRGEWRREPDAVRARLGDFPFPVFVKPARAGSSVGVSRVASLLDFDRAMETALAEDSRALVEVGVRGREVEVGVLSGRDGDIPRASLPGEIELDEGRFYDFDLKYRGGEGARVVCPAQLDDDTIAGLQATAIRAFEAIEGAGLARVDCFVSPEHGIVVNEINTMPGFTAISMFPVVWESSGIGYADLITELIELGLEEDR
ncbi:D-alanine--D-alanine ligase family protein [Agrococcus beijingensis]|uniref:D-alanine--D-alanine ligase family protein n=1 Tax=Agrococcus beijingensis TaxID=3068634 RepID=UPI0027426CFB|nr:D-alanine--D-alanine ligase family protein [Agrococcus sp. REN33]